jgi:Fic family protein
VVIHPFLNGNGRWSRMLANIYLKQNELKPTKWNEDLLAQENIHRGDYIKALKQADNGDYELLSRPFLDYLETCLKCKWVMKLMF